MRHKILLAIALVMAGAAAHAGSTPGIAAGMSSSYTTAKSSPTSMHNRANAAMVSVTPNCDLQGCISPTLPTLSAPSGGSTTGSLSGNGWVKFENGLYMQWGAVYVPGQGCAYWPYPVKMPTATFSVMTTPRGGSSGGGKEDFHGVGARYDHGVVVCTLYDAAMVFDVTAIGY